LLFDKKIKLESIKIFSNRVFPFFPDRSCNTFVEVLDRYLEITPLITLSGMKDKKKSQF